MNTMESKIYVRFETLHGLCSHADSSKVKECEVRNRNFSNLVWRKIMADPYITNFANAYRDWVNRRKATLDKLTTLANTRSSQMLCDNIKETITKLKQSAEGGIDAYKECILAETDRSEHTKLWKERAEELEQVLADSLESATTATTIIDTTLCHRTPPPPPLCNKRLPRHHDGLTEATHTVSRLHPI